MPTFKGDIKGDDTVRLRRILSLVCPMVCAACLMAGYALNSRWISIAAGASTGLVWLLANKRPATLPPSVALVISFVWVAAGLMAGASSFLMILGTTFALASWDLALFDHALADSPISSAQTIALFQNRHYRSLALALGLGLLVVVVGRLFRFQIPFGWMVVLVILALFSLERIWRTLIG